MIGTRVGMYEIVDEIGRGGMATVYRAYQPRVDRFVAVKVIQRAIAADPASLERFNREARLITQLEHPHLLPVYDYDGQHDPPYIVMRYLESGTLKDVLERQGALPLGEIAFLMRQITQALDYAHRQGVIHRDIKPSNIMVDQDGNAFLMDFGIARLTEGSSSGLTQTGFAVGTPGYMSPEQGLGESTVDGRTDIYALGVMLFEMATGRMPYSAATPMAVIMKHIQDDIPSATAINPDLPEEFDDIIRKAMAKNPDDRYATGSELADTLSDVAGSISYGRAPTNLRAAAQAALVDLQKDRVGRQDEIDATMSTFAEMRAADAVQDGKTEAVPGGTPSSGIGAVDGPTQLTPTGQRIAEIKAEQASPQQTERSRLPLIIAAVVVAIVIIGGLLAVLSGNAATEAANATATADAQAIAAQATTTADAEATNAQATNEAINAATESFEAGVAQTRTADASLSPEATPIADETLLPDDLTATAESDAIFDATATLNQVTAPTMTVTLFNPPTDTPQATPTHTTPPTDTNTPRPTSTPRVPILSVTRSLVVRTGPGANFDTAGTTLNSGDVVEIRGQSDDGRWYLVLLPDGSQGWVISSPVYSEGAGNLEALSVITVTPSRTPRPTNTATLTPSHTATFTPSVTPTLTPSHTWTPTFTPSHTPTLTPSHTWTPTFTPSHTPTLTPSHTWTPTFTPSHTPTLTPSHTWTPTFTPSFTPTLTPSHTWTPTFTPTFTPTATHTAAPTATPVPLGGLPYVADFEGANPLRNWDFNPDNWQIVNEGGQNILVAQSNLNNPMIVLGRDNPQWTNEPDFVYNMRFNIDSASGTRVIFRYQDGVGYNALELLAGQVILRRNATSSPNIFNRDTERVVRSVSADIRTGTWHEVTLWVEGSRLYVYLDRRLVVATEDLNTPQLGPGQIMLQANNAFAFVRYDDILIQRADEASDHFETGSLPPNWVSDSFVNVEVQTESNGNNYIRMRDAATLRPDMDALEDFALRCRIWSEQGGYRLHLRSDDNETLVLDAEAGNLTIAHETTDGTVLNSDSVGNYYTRGIWQDLDITFVGDRLSIFLGGQRRFEENLDSTPTDGVIYFETGRNDIVRIDDCLITRTSASRTAGGLFAFEVLDAVNDRTFRDGRSDFLEAFDDSFRTEDWWFGGRSAEGTFTEDPTAFTNSQFLSMTYGDRPTWRLFRPVLGVSLFGEGNSVANSTDVVATVQIRIPDAPGSAYLAIRTDRTLTGADLNGYFVELERGFDGATLVRVRVQDNALRSTLFEGVVEGTPIDAAEWTTVQIVSLGEEVAFFAGGAFITSLDEASLLGGTVALGVGEGTTAYFDQLTIRDTTPHGE